MKTVVIALTLAATAGVAVAQPPQTPRPRRIEAALAREAAETAIATCLKENVKLSAAVVDAAGNPILVLAPDNADPRTADWALRKAITAAYTGKASGETPKLAQTDAALKEKLAAPGSRFITWQGGLPILVGETVVGALATSGGPSAKDEACSKAGIDKIQARLK